MNLSEIQQAISQLEQERANLPNLSLAAIESRIQSLGARCIVDPSLKGELEQTIYSKSEAERHHQRAKEIGNELARLAQDLELAEQFERTARAEDASRQCREAYAEYVAASKATARAFRRVMQANQRAWNVPGAVRAPEDYRLHLPAIYSLYWQGTVGQHMQTALMPFEQSEKEQQNG